MRVVARRIRLTFNGKRVYPIRGDYAFAQLPWSCQRGYGYCRNQHGGSGGYERVVHGMKWEVGCVLGCRARDVGTLGFGYVTSCELLSKSLGLRGIRQEPRSGEAGAGISGLHHNPKCQDKRGERE
jgi:hypothetical protein